MDVPLDIDLPDPILLAEGWTRIKLELEKLNKIIEECPEPRYSQEDFHKTYQMIFTMCNQFPPHDYSEQLYDKYKQTFEGYINTIVLPSLTEKDGEVLLEELIVRWEKYKILVRWFSHIFSYLERVLIDDMPLNEVGIKCFRDMINQEREGEQVNASLLRRVLHLFLTGEGGRAFADAFGKSLVKASDDYYSRNAETWFMNSSRLAYLKKASECLKKESERAAHFFDEDDGFFEESAKQKLHSYTDGLTETVNANLLEPYASMLINDENFGCYALLKDQREEDLSRMYNLLLPFCAMELNGQFTKYITDEGTTLVQRADEAASNQARQVADLQKQTLVRNLIDLNYKSLAYLKRNFGSSYHEFHQALIKVFEEIWRKSVAGSPILELLAASCDNILKNDQILTHGLNEDSDFIKVVQQVKYVRDKELFAEHYRIMLAHRLFSKRDTYDDDYHDLEKKALEILNLHCGQDISKMFAMLEDMKLTKGRDELFESYLLENPDTYPDIDFRVAVITNGIWPFPQSFDICLPAEMVKCSEAFEPYFKDNWLKNAKLGWAHSLGNCHINGTFDQKTIELVASVDQAAALLLFNSSERLSFSEIMTELNLEEDHTVKLLHSLSCAKFKILTKEPKNMIVSPTDYFEFNSAFTDHKRKIKIIDCLQDPLQQEEESRKLAAGNVEVERKYAIQLALMRIMKIEKSLSHKQLVSRCLEYLERYQLEYKAIKAEIECLIDMEYLRRNQDNTNMYEYLEAPPS